jgi:hypothetical protein
MVNKNIRMVASSSVVAEMHRDERVKDLHREWQFFFFDDAPAMALADYFYRRLAGQYSITGVSEKAAF